jgi:iron complex outermembrane recepter protein
MPIRLMNRLVTAIVLALIASGMAHADDFDNLPESGDVVIGPVMPEVLTATRLRQPRSEVPASMTIIEAEQIEAWGVRTIQELLRFVPGMFIGHGDDENNDAIAYHASSPNVMRRLQVLVDGRSVYRAGIASVIWDDIPVALEDIQRIEVTRGPNSATWGANSFLGVINIVTRHPADTAGTRLRYRKGNQGIDDAFASYSWQGADSAWRISSSLQADDGFDGRRSSDTGSDDLRDSRRHGFVNLTRQAVLDNGWQLASQAGIKRGHTDIRAESYDLDPPDQDTDQGYVWNHLSRDFNPDHSLSLQGYWQYDHRRVRARSCAPTVGFDSELFGLYQHNPDLVNLLAQKLGPASVGSEEVNRLVAGMASGALSAADLESVFSASGYEVSVSEDELATLQGVLGRSYNGSDYSNLAQFTCGQTDRSVYEERLDVELQDTRRWSPEVRTLFGLNLRRDQVSSRTYFDGTVNNDTYRLFGTIEYRPLYWLLLNTGGSFEHEDSNGSSFSPRIAANLLLTQSQSIRLVYSEAVRSPDLLEKSPAYSIRMSSMQTNYLGLDSGRYYMNQWPGSRDVSQEKIVSREMGYYARLFRPDIEIDIKIYQDHMSNLISDVIALNTVSINSDTHMRVQGAEMQLNWRANASNWLWLSGAYTDADVRLGDTSQLTASQIASKEVVELRLTPTNSMAFSWHYQQKLWDMTLSHIWYDAYNEFNSNPNVYRRYEVNVRGNLRMGRLNPWVGVHVQHRVSDDALVYYNQRYADRNTGFLQFGLNY